ncbi:MAG: AI-2E family transporter, partial [Terriglobales bacterium]
MTILDSRTSRVLLTAFLFVVGLGFLYAARRTLILFLFAIFFAYLINPAVGRLEKLVHSRGWAIGLIYILLLVALAIFGFLVGPRIARQSARLGSQLPGLLDQASTGQLSGQIGQIAERIGNERGWSEATQQRIQGFLLSRRGQLAALAQSIGLRVAEAAQQMWVLFLVPILAIFFLRDGGNFHEVLLALVQSRSQRQFLQDVLQDLNQMLAQFIRAQLTLAALSFMAYSSMLGVMRVPYA